MQTLCLAAVTSLAVLLGKAGDACAQPLPPPRPPATEDTVPLPPPAPPREEQKIEPTEDNADAAFAACPKMLTVLGVRFESRGEIREEECFVDDAVVVSGLPGDIALEPPATLTCPLAEALARWSVEVLSAEAERRFETRPAALLIGTSYQCRNQRSGSKLSEHAFGNAVDLMGVRLSGRAPLTVGTIMPGSPEAAFETAIREGACRYFTTVLGPGSDEAHKDHLHLDLRGRKGGYRLCQ
jgi:hypothetical protein